MKVGDEVVVIYSKRFVHLVKNYVGHIYKISWDEEDDEFMERCRFIKTETGFLDDAGKEWVSTEFRNFPKECVRKATKLEKALR